MPINFCAEVSSNHHQNINRCYDFIDTAAQIGCNSVKFQLFKIEELFHLKALQKNPSLNDRKQWELPVEFIPKISERSKKQNLLFSCTPFYLDAVDELVDYVDFFKIASYEILWKDLLIKCAHSNKPVVFSTGMANLEEIDSALRILLENDCSDITILHCSSVYPTKYYNANLHFINTMREKFKKFEANSNIKYGWSDHTVDESVIYRSINKFDCDFIEFHLDIDGKGAEFSSGHCWLPNQISSVIENVNKSIKIENVNKSIEIDGNKDKKMIDSEIDERNWRADPNDGLRPIAQFRDKIK